MKNPRAKQGVIAGILTFVLLDGIPIFWFYIIFQIFWDLRQDILILLLVSVFFACICGLFGYGIASCNRGLIIVSSIFLFILLVFDVLVMYVFFNPTIA